MPKTTVIYAPFQVPYLSPDHMVILQDALKEGNVLVALPYNTLPPTLNTPYDFSERAGLIQSVFPSIICAPVLQQKYKDNYLTEFLMLSKIFFGTENIHLIIDESLAKDYSTVPTELSRFFDGEQAVRTLANTYSGKDVDAVYYRLGILEALRKQYPTNYPTVDIALINGSEVLLGKKHKETGWRFPGGFKDRKDKSLEETAIRELGEEAFGGNVQLAQKYTTKPDYIGSRNVDDWRYKDQRDGIITTFFGCFLTSSTEVIKAGDDLAEVKWFNIEMLDRVIMEAEHIFLRDMFLDWYKNA